MVFANPRRRGKTVCARHTSLAHPRRSGNVRAGRCSRGTNTGRRSTRNYAAARTPMARQRPAKHSKSDGLRVFTSHAADPTLPWVAKLAGRRARLAGRLYGDPELRRQRRQTATGFSPPPIACAADIPWKRVEVTLGALDVLRRARDPKCRHRRRLSQRFRPSRRWRGMSRCCGWRRRLPYDLPIAPSPKPTVSSAGHGLPRCTARWRWLRAGAPTSDGRRRRHHAPQLRPDRRCEFARIGEMAVKPLPDDPYPLCLGESGAPLILSTIRITPRSRS